MGTATKMMLQIEPSSVCSLIQQQLPHLAVQVELEQLEHLGVDEQQHQRQGGDDGRDEAQRLLSGQHEAQGKTVSR